MEEIKKGESPALRHHIAHFCPNLDIARECIYTCMKVGKPAFCGKDHKCYCGHKYSEHDKNPEININDMHLQFRDLYTKYFGPEDGKSIETIENK
ncbi:Naphthoate synthase [Operophtera brumata]|uniref:Naphthoate synthase n=1 Tax=Operophtera brumata TaxID=104452 RepID=A0A0L7L4P3_OPEBR|nr:Naphthoate synthase [Operophtera brumata]